MFGQSLLSGAFGSAACTTDTDQLFTTDATTTSTATYQFNNNLNSIGGSNNGSVSSGSASYTTGVFGQAADFGSWNVSVPNLAATLQNTALSFSFWATAGNSTSYYLMSAGSSGGTRKGFLIGTVNGTINIRFNNFGTTYFNINASMPSGFNHYVCTFDNTTNTNGAKIYVNGVLTTQGTSTGLNNFTFSTSTFFIGSEPTDSGQGPSYTSSNLDQLRIFTSAVSQAQVTALYNETVATSSSASINYQLANPNSIAYYKMSDATDQLGNYNGTAYKVNFNTVGKFGFAGKFNGSDSRIALGSASSLVGANFSFSAWIRKTQNNDGFIVGTNINPYYSKVALESKADGRIRCLYGNYTSNEGNFFSTFNSLNNGQWHHIVYFISQTTAKLYVNGSLDTTHTLTVTPNTGVSLTLGTLYQDNSNSYSTSVLDGEIDQVRIYNSELSAANVTTLYEEIECPGVTVNTYLVVGGGGGSGSYGGGGAGGYLSNFNRTSINFATGVQYTITVGLGGVTSSAGTTAGTNGVASELSGAGITTITASGGGYGGNIVSNINANSGASGGGGASDGAGAGGAGNTPSTTPFQGNAGGIGFSSHPNYSGGGGGGSAFVGNGGSGSTGGNGGNGLSNSITGSAVAYAGGGGGTGYAYPSPGTPGIGGSGGGATANAYGSTGTVSNATPNTGGGGGANGATYSNGGGGSGIVILRYSSTKSLSLTAGSLSTGVLNASAGSDKYTTFTGGTGTITFS